MPFQIIPFKPAHSEAFRLLNEAWISKYFVLEEPDRKALADPQAYIIEKGGHIFMANSIGEAVGSCALIKDDDNGYELAKMAVDERFQGNGIGRALLIHSIDFARSTGAAKVWLLTNSRMKPAIHLYLQAGFIEKPLPPTEYARADMYMEIEMRG